jgi:hypothetical protein
MVRIVEDLACDWRGLDERVEGLSNEIETIARQDAGCERLMSVPGIGPIISSAMVAARPGENLPTGWRPQSVWAVLELAGSWNGPALPPHRSRDKGVGDMERERARLLICNQ